LSDPPPNPKDTKVGCWPKKSKKSKQKERRKIHRSFKFIAGVFPRSWFYPQHIRKKKSRGLTLLSVFVAGEIMEQSAERLILPLSTHPCRTRGELFCPVFGECYARGAKRL